MGEYLCRLKWVASQYVVLFDVGGRRAWLIDGATALLHLVRTSLSFTSSEDLIGEFVFAPSSLQEALAGMTGRAASISVLKCPQNLGLRLYRTMRETFLDRVNEIYHLLEKIFAYDLRINLLTEVGMDTRRCFQGPLEGFDFMDIATDTDNFSARMVDPSSSFPR
jgi:hypothetical protein